MIKVCVFVCVCVRGGECHSYRIKSTTLIRLKQSSQEKNIGTVEGGGGRRGGGEEKSPSQLVKSAPPDTITL